MIIVSGLSGAGKTVALHTLEDLGYYCIDNLPSSLLPALYEEQKNIPMPVAVGIDVRSQNDKIRDIPDIIQQFKEQGDEIRVLYLTANRNVLIKRFSESRRKHPLSTTTIPLHEAIEKEKRVLAPLVVTADYKIDTSKINIYELKDRISEWLAVGNRKQTTITIESFGFKNGVPIDADLMFDVRFLPNPYWESDIRHLNGKDKVIQEYLGKFEETNQFINNTAAYLERWLPTYLTSYRTYLTIAIGCTGGKHRSVYVTEKIAEILNKSYDALNIRHRDLPKHQ